MEILCIIGLVVLTLSALTIDAAGRVSLNAAAAVYSLGVGGAVLALSAPYMLLARR